MHFTGRAGKPRRKLTRSTPSFAIPIEQKDEEEEDKKNGEQGVSASLDDNNKEASTTALPAATRTAPPKVEPHGAEVLREIIARRRRDKSVRQRQDRIRRQAYQQVRVRGVRGLPFQRKH